MPAAPRGCTEGTLVPTWLKNLLDMTGEYPIDRRNPVIGDRRGGRRGGRRRTDAPDRRVNQRLRAVLAELQGNVSIARRDIDAHALRIAELEARVASLARNRQ